MRTSLLAFYLELAVLLTSRVTGQSVPTPPCVCTCFWSSFHPFSLAGLATQETSSFPLPLAKVHAHNEHVLPVALFEALGEGKRATRVLSAPDFAVGSPPVKLELS